MTPQEINTEAMRLAAIDVKAFRPMSPPRPIKLPKHTWAMAEVYASILHCTPEQAILTLLNDKLNSRCSKALYAEYREMLQSSSALRSVCAYAAPSCAELAVAPGGAA